MPGGQDIAYQTFDTSGHLRSAGRWGGPDNDTFGGIGVDPSGNVLIAGMTTAIADPGSGVYVSASTENVYLVKLAP
jgi:hypothetical protein